MEMLQIATKIVIDGFRNKKDKGGKPYVLHLFRVMHNLNSTDEELNCIALLHDAVEDDVITIQELRNIGFGNRICIAVSLLTHDPGISYQEYIKSISHNKDAVMVKISDLKDNMDVSRLDYLLPKDIDRIRKYHDAYMVLTRQLRLF